MVGSVGDDGGGAALEVSIVLPTFRRPAALRRALGGLAAQGPAPRFEVVVVDNDADGSARATVAAASAAVRGRVRYVIEPRRGATHARNRGIGEARGGVVVTLDDDVVPAPGWLAALVAPIADGRADAVGGRVLLDPSVRRPRWFDEGGIGGYLTHLDLGPADRALGAGEIIITASAAFRAGLLRDVGGFDVAFGPRGRTQLVNDDVQVLRAVQAAGGIVWWAPQAVVTHELPPARLRPSWIVRRAYLQGRSDWMVDRPALEARRANGARIALTWLRRELGQRRREGLRRPEVAFHAACDVARTLGSLREALGWGRARSRDPGGATS